MDTISLPTHADQRCPSGGCACARVWSLAGMYTVSAAVGALAGSGLAAFNAWGEGVAIQASVTAGVCVLVTALVVLGVFRVMNFGMVATKAAPRPTVPPTMLTAMSTARLLLSLAVGLGAYLTLKPDGKTFWVAFLLGGLLCLLVETAWSVRWLRAASLAREDSSAGTARATEVGS